MFQEGGSGYTALGRYENSKEKRKITQIKRGHGFKKIFRNLSRLDSKAGWISKNAEEVTVPPSDHQRAQLELAGGPSRKPATASLFCKTALSWTPLALTVVQRASKVKGKPQTPDSTVSFRI